MDRDASEPARGRSVLLNIFAIVVIVCIFSFLGWRLWIDRELLRGIEWWASPGLWASHFALLMLLFGVATLAWVRILRVFGGDLDARAGAFVWLTSNLGKYIPGKLFMLAGRVELCRQLGVRPAISVSALALEHVMQLLAAGPFVLWVVLRGFRYDADATWLVVLVALTVATVCVVRPSLLVRCANLVLRLTNRPSLSATPKPGDSAFLLFLYFTAWSAYGASGVVLFEALGLGSTVPVLDIVAGFVAAWMIGFLSLITPGGIGVREAVLVLLFGAAISAPEAITIALIARLSWTLVEMAGVVAGVLIGRRIGIRTGP